MLVLTRKPGEAVCIGSELRVEVVSVSGRQVRLAIQAPDHVAIHREEVIERIARTNLEIRSRRFGRVEVDAADVIHFEGLPGFPDARRFVLLAHDEGSPFAWLVCVDEPELAFVVANPLDFFPDYAPRLTERQRRALLLTRDPQDLELLVIADVRGGETRLNLRAPLVISAESRRGAQVILEGGEYGVAEPIPALPEEREARG